MSKKIERLNEININKQNCTMKIIQYNSKRDRLVEFQDEYKGVVHTNYYNFKVGQVKNPYYPSVCNGMGIVGNKYPICVNKKNIKEYQAWSDMLKRVFKSKYPTYKDVICCKEWLLYENFYEWIHSQENFDKWYNGSNWALDKDILIKGNKVYSPETCCLVPHEINTLFVKSEKTRGDYPIGVSKRDDRSGYSARIIYGRKDKKEKFSSYQYPTIEEAFCAYKESKEKYIKEVAKESYEKGDITKQCYDAMINYQIEITD
jgi:hypothetical protein